MVDQNATDVETTPPRPPHRQMIAALVIGVCTMQALGMTLKMPTLIEANDISRWCTVWSLVERGTYVIDDCPWQVKTQDKVFVTNPWEKVEPGKERPRHFYSSKPPLLPTLIAGVIYPFRAATGISLDYESLQVRIAQIGCRSVEASLPSKPQG